MVEEHFSGKLDRQAFPFVGNPSAGAGAASLRSDSVRSTAGAAPTSLRSARPRWTAGAKGKPTNEPRQRAIVFMAGGMTYSEIRSAYQISQALNKDVYIGVCWICLPGCSAYSASGSTHIAAPENFVRDLGNLDRAPPTSAKDAPSRPQQQQQHSSSSNSHSRPHENGRHPEHKVQAHHGHVSHPLPSHSSHHPPDPRDQRSNGRAPSSGERSQRPTEQQYAQQPQYQQPPPGQHASGPQQSYNFQQAPQGQRNPQSANPLSSRPPAGVLNSNFSNDSRSSLNSQGEPAKKRGLFGRSKK